YVVRDVTHLLVPGENIVAVMVATGRYREPHLSMELRVGFEDGSEQVITTSHDQWWWSPVTPVLKANLYDGETYEARIVIPGWNGPGPFLTAGLLRPLTAEPPGGGLRVQDLEPIRVISEIPPVSSTPVDGPDGAVVYDLGQNIAGWAHIRVRGKSGTRVTLRFSEALRDDGQVEMRMNRGAAATDIYVLAGGEREEWEPAFTYLGFRYVQIHASEPLESLEVIGKVVRSAVEKVGEFTCGNEMATRLRTACEWTEGDNLHGVPTDCPQREERFGWLNDMSVRAESAMYTFRLGLLYAKWAEDIANAQGPVTGAITDVAPYDPYHARHFGNRPADPVSASYLLVCWLGYLHYTDLRLLERRYNGLVRWFRYLQSQAERHILRYSYWGDWASAREYAVKGSVGSGAVSAITPGDLVSTAFLYYDATILAGIARALGKPDDATGFLDEATDIKDAFDREFFGRKGDYYAEGSQASQAIPLAFGLAPPNRVGPSVAHLVADIHTKDDHLSTGNLASRYVLEVLSDHGHIDLAWALATQTTYPSWGYMMEHGATTIWERWEHLRDSGMNSHNHPMYATVSGWFSKYIAGIRPSEEAAGFERILLRPGVPRGLDWARGSLKTLRGTVVSEWKRTAGGTVEFTVTVPPSSSASIGLPAVGGDSTEVLECSIPGKATREFGPDGSRLFWDTPGGTYRIVLAGGTHSQQGH
ncbi:MAG: hypothetical protein E4H09_02335, partial [Spirochaetales bacterium]